MEALAKVVITKNDIKAEAFKLRKAGRKTCQTGKLSGRRDAHIAHVTAVGETSLEHERTAVVMASNTIIHSNTLLSTIRSSYCTFN